MALSAMELAKMVASLSVDTTEFDAGLNSAKQKLKDVRKEASVTAKIPASAVGGGDFRQSMRDLFTPSAKNAAAAKLPKFAQKEGKIVFGAPGQASKGTGTGAGAVAGVASGATAAQQKVHSLTEEVKELHKQLGKKTPMSPLRSELNNIVNVAKKLRNYAMTYFGMQQLFQIGKSFITVTSNMEMYRQRLRMVINDQRTADALFERTVRWAAVSPIDTDEAIGAFTQLKAAAVDNAEGAIRTVANMSAVVFRDMRDVAAAIISGETEALRRLGIQVLRNGKNAVITSGQFKRVVADNINAIRKAILTVAGLNYEGAMEKSKHTFLGIVKTIKGQIHLIQKDVMGLDTGTPFRAFTDELEKMSYQMEVWSNSTDYQKFIGDLQNGLTTTIKIVGSLSRAIMVAFDSGIPQIIGEWYLGFKLATSALRTFKDMLLGLPNVAEYLRSLGLGAWVLGPAGIALGTAAALGANMDWGPRGPETLEERQGGFGKLSTGKTAVALQIARENEIIAAEIKDRLKMYDNMKDMELDRQTNMHWALNLASVPKPAYDATLIKTRQEIVNRFVADYELATNAIKTFGLDADRVYADLADDFVSRSQDIVKELQATYGFGGVPALIAQLEKLKGQIPGIELIVNAFKNIKNEAGEAAKRITGMTSEVAKAAAQGLISKGTAQKYLNENISKAIGYMQKEVTQQYEGAPQEIITGLLEARIRAMMEGAGWKRALPQWKNNPAFMRSALGTSIENQFMAAGADIYGFNRQRAWNQSGQIGQPGTIGDPNSRYETRPQPYFGAATSQGLLAEQARLADAAIARSKTRAQPTIIINGMTLTDSTSDKARRALLDTIQKNNAPVSLTILGAAQ